MRSACVYLECPITGMILGVSRKDDPNAFGLPGGKVEEGETEAWAAARELREETGILTTTNCLTEVFRRESGVTFRLDYRNIMPTILKVKEAGRVRWVTPYQLIQGPFGAYNRQLLRVVARIGNEPTFERGKDPRNEVCLRCGQHIRNHYGYLYRCEPRGECPSCGTDEHYDDECTR